MIQKNEEKREKSWITKSLDNPTVQAQISKISAKLNLHPVVASLLYSRGYTDAKECASFLRMENEMLENPFRLIDMEKGTERIIRALKNNERITVYGDYDVDGVTSVCTLYLYLKSIGADIHYYIPNRSGEGYGVSCSAIDTIAKEGTTLIITVDTGITANNEVEYAKTIGVDFLITDHHECRSVLPNAVAVINPHRPDCPYPFKELAGVGVVFKLLCALEEKINKLDRTTATLCILKKYADLVAIGTIADVMPIKHENRIIVKYGLSLIDKSARVGIAALIDVTSQRPENRRADKVFKRKRKTKVTSGFVGFTLAPRINAAGRVRSATVAAELFLCESYDRALEIAVELCDANKQRQNEENSIMQEAYKKIEELDIDNNPVIVLDADNWHHGVIGIVASRITEKYSRPSILVSFEGNNNGGDSALDVGKGSGRSIKGLNLVDALCSCSDLLVKFGGHELAAGLSVTRENLPLFREAINQYARNNLNSADMCPTIEADIEINSNDISLPLAEQLQLLEPYGVGNPVPLFVLRDAYVNEICGVSDGKHTRLVLGGKAGSLSSMFFGTSPDMLGISVGDKIDVLFSIDINEWQDRKSVQLIIRDLKLTKSKKKERDLFLERFNEIRLGATFSESENVLPTRHDFAAVYTFVQNSARMEQTVFSMKELLHKLSYAHSGVNIGYVKLKFIIMIFKEMNLITIEEREGEVYEFKMHYVPGKINLDKSSILRKLRTQIR